MMMCDDHDKEGDCLRYFLKQEFLLSLILIRAVQHMVFGSAGRGLHPEQGHLEPALPGPTGPVVLYQALGLVVALIVCGPRHLEILITCDQA